MRLTVDSLVLGALLGACYGLLGIGLVLVSRATRVINLAQTQLGTLCAAVLARLVLDDHWSFWLALPTAIAVGAGLGALVEVLVIRRLTPVARVVVLAATLGVSQLLVLVEYALPSLHHAGASFPSPLHVRIELPASVLGSPEVMVMISAPVVVLALVLVLTRTRLGLAIRTSAANPDAASLAGIPVARTSATVWALAGGLGALTAVLLSALQGTTVTAPDAGITPGLLVRALIAALAGGLVSLPRALAGGIVWGIVESGMRFAGDDPGTIDLVALVVVLVLVLARRRGEADEEVSLPIAAPSVPGRWSATFAGAAALAAALLPLVVHDAGTTFLLTRAVILGLVALSVTVLTGWAGQLSLGQVALFGLGAMTTARLVSSGVPFGAAVVLGAVAGALAGLVIGVPAMLTRGLLLATTTLAFAVAAESWLLQVHLFGGPAGLRIHGHAIGRSAALHWHWVCVAVVAAVAISLSRLRRTGVGRRIIAARTNPRRAEALGIHVAAARIAAFGLAGALAGLAGGLFTGLSGAVDSSRFPVFDSLLVVAAVAVGGLGSVSGALIGTALLVGVPALWGNSTESLVAVIAVGLTGSLLLLPGGLVGLVPHRQRRPAAGQPLVAASTLTRTDDVLLEVRDVTVRFGGRLAVDGVDLQLRHGEVLGLVGANGAGKSTLLDVLSGFAPVERGQVGLHGWDVTRAAPDRRPGLGLGRSFQDARLFADLTVLECLLVAQEGTRPSELVPSLLALPPSRRVESQQRERAAGVVALLGLEPWADALVSMLPTGTRRTVELGCLVAQGAPVIVLDEPAAGLSQAEVDAFAPLLRRVQAVLGASVLLVEHDLELVRAVSDRLQCLEQGRTIAVGGVDEVLADPLVRATWTG